MAFTAASARAVLRAFRRQGNGTRAGGHVAAPNGVTRGLRRRDPNGAPVAVDFTP